MLVLLGMLVSVAHTQTKAERIHELMAHYHALGRHNGTILVAMDGEVIYEGGFGPADATWGIPNEPNVKYDIGSVTKHFTGLLVMQQVERGAIRLDVPAATYLSSFPVSIDERITIAHLLTHQSGITDFANDLSTGEFETRYLHHRHPPDSVVADMLRRPPEFEPGVGHGYSNTGYVLLGLILEAVTGREFCDLLLDEVLKPAGMSDSGCSRFDPIIPRRATGYRMEGGRLIHIAYWHSSYADGEMYSTVRDLYRFDFAIRSGRLLSPEMQAVMNTPRVEVDMIGDDFGPGLKHYTGYGIESVHRRPGFAGNDSVAVIGHGGGGGGFTSMLWRVPEDGVVIAVLNNMETPPLYPELFDILYDRPYKLPNKDEVIPRKEL